MKAIKRIPTYRADWTTDEKRSFLRTKLGFYPSSGNMGVRIRHRFGALEYGKWHRLLENPTGNLDYTDRVHEIYDYLY